MLAFNLNKWLQLIGRDADNPFHWEEVQTSRFKHLYIATRLVETGRKTVIRFAANYPYQEYFNRLMSRLRKVVFREGMLQSVIIEILFRAIRNWFTGSLTNHSPISP